MRRGRRAGPDPRPAHRPGPVIVIGLAFLVLSSFLAPLALVFGLVAPSRAGHMCSLRLVRLALVWLVRRGEPGAGHAGRAVASGFADRMCAKPYITVAVSE